ncbi:MAG: gamma carbonic anhydrase family protein [Thermoplasmata archaeon]|nr:gamma carbonic anhydrase family protein [Thermoplasmata archaeon]
MEEHENVIAVAGKSPEIDATAYVDPSARVIGHVIIEQGAAIYPGCVLRAEDAPIYVRRNAVVLDMCFIEAPKGSEVVIGEAALVSHRVTVHGAQVGASTLVGIGSILLDRAVVGKECIVSADSLVPPRKHVEDRSLVVGSPARVKRKLDDADVARIRASHEEAWEKARLYGQSFGAAPMEGMTSGIGQVKIDGDIFAGAPDKLKRKMGRQFGGVDFDTMDREH